MLDELGLLVEAFKDHIRVNVTMKSVEIYNEHGVQMVLRNLDEETYETFKRLFVNF